MAVRTIHHLFSVGNAYKQLGQFITRNRCSLSDRRVCKLPRRCFRSQEVKIAILAANGAGADAPPPRGFSFRLIAAPHEIMEREIAAVTRFDLAPLLELDGEAG